MHDDQAQGSMQMQMCTPASPCTSCQMMVSPAHPAAALTHIQATMVTHLTLL
jgi:hypothetical protein